MLVIVKNKIYKSSYNHHKNRIRIHKNHRYSKIVLHEIAHGLQRNIFGLHRTAAHGPEFVGIYMRLLNTYDDYSMSYIYQTAKKYNINYTEPYKMGV